jgi:threonine/homoserine/homoserine lactone efflux protein
MEILISLLLGTVMGILFAVPLGPISLFVAQQTLNNNTRNGLRVAAGSTVIDVLYCLVITLGFLSLVSNLLQNHWVQLSLSALMIAYGVYMLVKDGRGPRTPAMPVAPTSGVNWHYLLGSTMALANPTLLLSWTAALSFLSANRLLSVYFWDKVLFSFAVGLGNLLWFIALALFVRSRRHALSQHFVKLLGNVTAFVIIGFGIYFAYTIFRSMTAA